MNNNIKLTSLAQRIIAALRRPAGTCELYRNTLLRIFNQVLQASDDLGMSSHEALETLRALDMIRRDLEALATTPTEDAPDGIIEVTEDETNSSTQVQFP